MTDPLSRIFAHIGKLLDIRASRDEPDEPINRMLGELDENARFWAECAVPVTPVTIRDSEIEF